MALFPESRFFGQLPSGETVEAWTLCGSGGLELEVITYGGIVTRLLAPDRDGRLADVVLGFSDLRSYLGGHPYFGAITGRVAGRITGAKFTLGGKVYELACNQEPNHLHGGVQGFDKKLWIAEPLESVDGASSLRLSYRSADGEEGYPGTVDVSVTYTVTDDNVFSIETEASTDRPTPFSLTNHSYFNLAGEDSGSIANHQLEIYADEYIPADEHLTLLGHRVPVNGKNNDFRQGQILGDAIPHLFLNHGDIYVLRDPALKGATNGLLLTAHLVDPHSGRTLHVSTTESYLQLYTGAALDGTHVGKSGIAYRKHAGVCLECHGYPDGANAPHLGDSILRPNDPRLQTTRYAFSTVAANDHVPASKGRSGKAGSSGIRGVKEALEATSLANAARS